MELIKWLLSVATALFITAIGVGVSIGAVIFLVFFKILGIIGIVTAGIALLVKEHIDERSGK
jgi:hypothetical protein